jgi:DNA invertase Pin-like site-specific DNA recombinase
MSTEHQRYSIANQRSAIAAYAEERRYEIVRSYEDAGKSGLTLKGRDGLQRLLADTLGPSRDFSAIIVLDVSRWGRFQDPDQAAHYEYLCRQAGVRVIYCAEPFVDDLGPMTSVLKNLKRVMAAEYSRELSVKLSRARLQQARLGFRQGGPIIYGFRRQLVAEDGQPRQFLERGHQKALRGERVRFALGQEEELATIRRMFELYLRPKATFAGIARTLNDEGIPSGTGGPWQATRIARLLRNELFIGQFTFNKVSKPLRGPPIRNPESDWVRVRVSDPIVAPATFKRVQKLARPGGRNRFTDDEMLDRLRRILAREGRLSPALIDRNRGTPAAATYEKRFGSIRNAYALIGYEKPPLRWRPELGGYWTNEAILDGVRAVHAARGYVSAALLEEVKGAPSYATVRKRFGSLRACYEMAGLPHRPSDLVLAAHSRRRVRLRGEAATDDMLDALRTVLRRHGRLSTSIVNAAPEAWSASSYVRIFGTLRNAFAQIGYTAPPYVNVRDDGCRTSREFLIEGLQRLLSTHGYVSGKLINQDPELPHEWVYRDRFGSLLEAYQLVGWTLTRGQLNTLGKVVKLGSPELVREAIERAKAGCPAN